MPTQFYPMTHADALALIAALNGFAPGLVTTTQRGFYAPDDCIEGGKIKLATNANKGLMSKAFAALLEDPDKIVFYANSVTGSAGFHNSLYRGKYLGDHVTDDQYAEISAGTFGGMFIGDYWEINNIVWRIAAFDYWLHDGDTECTTTHHVVVVPDSNLATAKMNNSNVTTGGYVGSGIYTGANSNTGLSTAKSTINTAFGSAHILNHRELLSNAVSDGKASGWAWYDSTVELMNESMVYGSPVSGAQKTGDTNFNVGIDYGQLPLFRYNKGLVCNRASWWLRVVASAATFATVNGDGGAYYGGASASLGVRPAFGIKA